MKRRTGDVGKLRRPLKRSKITEGFYGSTFLYLKFLMVWALVLMADFILEFRFEYLWPFWLLVRSVYDSFKYQGLAFSVFFVCIAITSDVVCYLFIPVQWLFFAASTYVWVQYVWHTERGICLPTVSLWLLFVYIEASVRLRELKSLPFNLDLCRPFAAHCIGYPVVTLGFGFKTYVSYKMRLRKQKEVQKENDFYFHLIQQALPAELQKPEKQKELKDKPEGEVISNGTVPSKKAVQDDDRDVKKSLKIDEIDYESPYIEQELPKKTTDVNVNDSPEICSSDPSAKSNKAVGIGKVLSTSSAPPSKLNPGKKGKIYPKENPVPAFTNNKEEYISRLENDVKRLKTDLQLSRNTEQELRSQLSTFLSEEKSYRSEIFQLQQDNENLQNKLHNLVTSRQQDKQNLGLMEKKLQDERKSRNVVEQQLSIERKAKKVDEAAAAARAVAASMAAATRLECTDTCKAQRRDIENDVNKLKWDIKNKDEQYRQLEREVQSLRLLKDEQNDTEVLMSALAAMQDKNTHLENSLKAETRLKLDLFSALGEHKRQMEILQGVIAKKDEEISDLKSKMTEVMALMPATSTMNGISKMNTETSSSSPLYSTKGSSSPDPMIMKSTLNPHASDYTPKAM